VSGDRLPDGDPFIVWDVGQSATFPDHAGRCGDDGIVGKTGNAGRHTGCGPSGWAYMGADNCTGHLLDHALPAQGDLNTARRHRAACWETADRAVRQPKIFNRMDFQAFGCAWIHVMACVNCGEVFGQGRCNSSEITGRLEPQHPRRSTRRELSGIYAVTANPGRCPTQAQSGSKPPRL